MNNKHSELLIIIQTLFNDIQNERDAFSHLLTFDEQYPDIEIKIDDVPLPYQVYDSYYHKDGVRYNKHFIFLPDFVVDNIINNGFHSGMSVQEYEDYTEKHKSTMSKSEFFCALLIHELSHVFQLYIQDYETNVHHTDEFYDVLEAFYTSPWIDTISSEITHIL